MGLAKNLQFSFVASRKIFIFFCHSREGRNPVKQIELLCLDCRVSPKGLPRGDEQGELTVERNCLNRLSGQLCELPQGDGGVGDKE